MISVIIISFNTKELLKNCLKSVFNDGKGEELEIWVVDNASKDGSAEMVKESFPKVKLIINKENLGFARANNQALRQAGGEYMLLLNSDIEIQKGLIGEMLNLAKNHDEVGVMGARLLNPDGSIQPSIFHFPDLKNVFKELKNNYFEKYYFKGDEPAKVDAVIFAAVLIPKKTIEKVGYLDERYFMYFEDLDYCRRVHQAGYKVYYLPSARAIHHHGASGRNLPHVQNYSLESSRIYHGILKYWLLTITLRMIHKWQKIIRY